MILQRYFYKNRPPVITIPKCGSRFVRKTDWYDIDEIDISSKSTKKYVPIIPESVVIYRNPREHVISAIKTDYIWGNYYGQRQSFREKIYGNTVKKWNLNTIVQNMIFNNSEHWSLDLYKNLYELWNNSHFKMLHLSNLSKLFNDEFVYDSTVYDSHELSNYKSKEEILSLIPKDKLNQLYNLCDIDEVWLNLILKNSV